MIPNLGFLARIQAEEIEANARHQPEQSEERARALDADEVSARADARTEARARSRRVADQVADDAKGPQPG